MEATSGVDDQVTALPGAGGGLRGLGERFQPDLLRGTGNYAVALEAPAGPNGLKPRLSLVYSSGQGNDAFGMGWQLAGPLAIQRGTDARLPKYDDSDTFLLGGEALVPVGNNRYRPQSDTQFWDIRRADHGWRIRTKDGRAYVLGAEASTRVSAGNRVSAWYCEEERDAAGNAIRYEYVRDRGQLYLSQIKWSIWAFRLIYEPRPDVLSQARAGFLVMTALRCSRIERHCERSAPSLCGAHTLSYVQARGSQLSMLTEIQYTGFGDGASSESLPPLRFAFSEYEPSARHLRLDSEDGLLPIGRPDTALVDMDGDGLPDLLQTDRRGHRYWKNLGGGRFGPACPVGDAPSGVRLGEPGVSFADLTGDGTADLFRADGRLHLAVLNTGAGRWAQAPRVAKLEPTLGVSAASSRLVDLDGDGSPDLLQSARHGFMLAYNNGSAGWTQPEVISRIRDADRFPDVDFDDDAIRLADMTGDGLSDIVALYSGRVVYWQSLGRGQWGPAIEMKNAPSLPRGFRQERAFLTDLDGDGTADLVYVDGDRILYWLNQSGEGWSEAFDVPFVPPPDISTLTMVDLLGRGTHGLCWANSRSGRGRGRFLDLGADVKPYLLTEVSNGFGATTFIQYESVSQLRTRAQDRDAWGTFLPFPLHVVRRLVEHDAVTGQTGETRLDYARGYFDPVGKVFRGFEAVELTSVGDAHTATTVQRTEFELGTLLGPEAREALSPEQRAQEHALSGSVRQVEVFQVEADGSRSLISRAITTWGAPQGI